MMPEPMLTVKNWDKFQHYKDRNPPWIKLYTDTFHRRDFNRLPDDSKLLALCIWTLAAREASCAKGSIPLDLDWIKMQCGLGPTVTKSSLQVLISQGFVTCDSDMLADCKQDAIPEERRGEKRKREKTPPADLSLVFSLWKEKLEPRGIPPLSESMTKTAQKAIQSLYKKEDWVAGLPDLFDAILDSDWHMGIGSNFVPSAKWLASDNATDLLYKFRSKGRPASQQPRKEEDPPWIAAEKRNAAIAAANYCPPTPEGGFM